VPPDLVILEADEPSPTPTLLWTGLDDLLATAGGVDALRDGVFLVRNGHASFYTSALTHLGFRYDPVCMRACDARARWLRDALRDATSQVTTTHAWRIARKILVIDNAKTLHARAAVTSSDRRRKLRRIAFRTGDVRSW